MKTLRKGDKGPQVQELALYLRRFGYAHFKTLPNRFGARVEAEVKRFQAQHLDSDGHPLDVDGVVGPKTWGVLLRRRNDEQRLGLGRFIPETIPGFDPCIPICANSQFTAPYNLLVTALSDYDAGRRETPLGSNICPWLEKRAQGKPWCSFQVHAWIKSVLGKWIFGGRRGSTRTDLRMAAKRDLIVDSPQPGDVFLLCDADGVPYHTGLVLRVGWDGVRLMQTIEGNCANRVAMREREITPKVTFWRPFRGELHWTRGLLQNVRRVEARRQGTR